MEALRASLTAAILRIVAAVNFLRWTVFLGAGVVGWPCTLKSSRSLVAGDSEPPMGMLVGDCGGICSTGFWGIRSGVEFLMFLSRAVTLWSERDLNLLEVGAALRPRGLGHGMIGPDGARVKGLGGMGGI